MQPEIQTQQPVFTGNTDVAVQQNKVLRNTYMLLAVSLIPTIVGAALGTTVFNIAGLMRGVGPIIASIAVLAIFFTGAAQTLAVPGASHCAETVREGQRRSKCQPQGSSAHVLAQR